MTPEISVVVPTFERPDQVDRLLSGLDVQTLAPEQFAHSCEGLAFSRWNPTEPCAVAQS